MKTIAITNQKGGVGKTTTAIHLAAGLAAKGYKTLIVDLDPQANTTKFFLGANSRSLTASMADIVAKRKQKIQDVVVQTGHSNLDIAPSSLRLSKETERAYALNFRESLLRLSLDGAEYDYVIIDCPPNLGILSINAILACHHIIVPCEMSVLSLDGLADLWDTIREIKGAAPENFARILLTQVDKRTSATNEAILEELKPFEPIQFSTRIARSEPLNQVYFQGELVFNAHPKSPGALDYQSLTDEVLQTWPRIS